MAWCHGGWASYGEYGPAAALVHGWIDNAADLAAELQVEVASPAAVYAAALTRWDDGADSHCIGNYAAIALLPDGHLRLARSPWDAPPLYHWNDGTRTLASPLLRVLFAAGAPKELDYERVIDELALDWRDGEEAGWYRGIAQVPVGCAVTIGPSGHRLDRWYSVDSLPQVRFTRAEDYVEAANALLDEAGAKSMAQCTRPAVALSGGLDSPLAADALLRAMPQGARLNAITFVPHPGWGGEEPPGLMGDESAMAEAFARFTGRIDLHLADPAQGGFDFRARDMFRAMEIFAPGLANVGMMHGVWAKARALGCDLLVTAEFGNQCFSDAGQWAYVEYARRGQWGQLLKLLRARPGDGRPIWRKLATLTVLPQLPTPMRIALRGLVHPARRDMTGLFTMLSKQARSERPSGAWADFTHARSREEASQRYALQANGPAADVHLAFEQLYGVRRRDLAAYRPLIEFCLGLPTEQFARDGEERRLARRMALGRMPEAQRRETRRGQHNIDWHARMTPRRNELLAYAEAMRGHPWLAQVADIDRMQDLLARWPEEPGNDWERDYPLMLGLPRIFLAAQCIGIIEGRNDL